jgi:hypothetical protein
MKSAFLAFFVLCSAITCGCTTLRPTEASPDEIQRLILSEGLLKPGDKVRLVTTDETVHEFRVTEVNLEQGLVSGKDDSVPIAEIVGVGTREIAVGKTVGRTLGISTGVFIGLAIAAGYTLSF